VPSGGRYVRDIVIYKLPSLFSHRTLNYAPIPPSRLSLSVISWPVQCPPHTYLYRPAFSDRTADVGRCRRVVSFSFFDKYPRRKNCDKRTLFFTTSPVNLLFSPSTATCHLFSPSTVICHPFFTVDRYLVHHQPGLQPPLRFIYIFIFILIVSVLFFLVIIIVLALILSIPH